MKKKLNLILVSLLIITFSCTYDKEAIEPISKTTDDNNETALCDSVDISFSTDVLPMLENNCTPCHIGGISGGHSWDNYSEVEADKGVILKAIKHEGAINMPKGEEKLSDDLIQIFECWINGGAQDN